MKIEQSKSIKEDSPLAVNRRSSERDRNFLDNLNATQLRVMTVLDGPIVKPFVSFVILLNAIQVVYETDIGSMCQWDKDQSACDQESGWLKVMNWIYLGIYSIELAFRIYVLRWHSLTDPWAIFDGSIILVGVLSEALGGLLPSTGILRLARLARIARAVKIIKLPPELHTMIHGFASALKAISMGAVLVFLMLTLWAIVGVEMLNGLNHDDQLLAFYADAKCDRCPTAWSSVPNAVFSFTQLMLMGEGWDLLAIPIVRRYPASIIIFILVFFTVVLGMTNLILAVIVDKALQAHEEDVRKEASAMEDERVRAVERFVDICRMMDKDGDNSIDLEELRIGFTELPEFRNILKIMGVSERDLEVLFHMMDQDGSGDVSYIEFAHELAKVRTCNVQTVACFTKFHVVTTQRIVQELADKLHAMELKNSCSSNSTAPFAGLCAKDAHAEESTIASSPILPAIVAEPKAEQKDDLQIETKAEPNKREPPLREDGLMPPSSSDQLETLLRELHNLTVDACDQAQSIATTARQSMALTVAAKVCAMGDTGSRWETLERAPGNSYKSNGAVGSLPDEALNALSVLERPAHPRNDKDYDVLCERKDGKWFGRIRECRMNSRGEDDWFVFL